MRGLDALLDRARIELHDNPTITVYRFVNGVERRRPAVPFAGMRAAIAEFRKAAEGAANSFNEYGAALRRALGAPLNGDELVAVRQLIEERFPRLCRPYLRRPQ